MAQQLGFTVDLAKCVGCKSCSVACAMENNTPVGVLYRDVIRQESGSYPAPSITFVSTACNHCKDASCVKSCPVGAMRKHADKMGVVLVDQSLCIGCRRCTFACPYGAPQYNEATKKTEKCTFCVHRVLDANGQLTGMKPACVSTCPAEALEFEVREDTAWTDVGTAPSGWASKKLTNPSTQFKRAF